MIYTKMKIKKVKKFTIINIKKLINFLNYQIEQNFIKIFLNKVLLKYFIYSKVKLYYRIQLFANKLANLLTFN